MQVKLSEIKDFIQSSDLENAGRLLLEFTQKSSSRFHNEVLGQLANLKQVLTDERKGIASPETTKLNKNRVTYALLELIDEIDEELSSKGTTKSPKKNSVKDKDFVFE